MSKKESTARQINHQSNPRKNCQLINQEPHLNIHTLNIHTLNIHLPSLRRQRRGAPLCIPLCQRPRRMQEGEPAASQIKHQSNPKEPRYRKSFLQLQSKRCAGCSPCAITKHYLATSQPPRTTQVKLNIETQTKKIIFTLI